MPLCRCASFVWPLFAAVCAVGCSPASEDSSNEDVGSEGWEYRKRRPPPTTDSTPPSSPANLTANAVSSSAVHLSWGAATDNVGVTGYVVSRGMTVIATL